jgi:type II secretory pathway component PulF
LTLFRYQALRADGSRVNGEVEATSTGTAVTLLSRRGLLPVRVACISPAGLPCWRRPSRRSIATVLQSISSLVGAGVPLQQAIEASAALAPAGLRDAITRIEQRVREGSSLASAADAENGLFSEVTIGLLRAGERGVGLGTALDQAAQQMEREAESSARIRAALAYPTLLCAVGCISIALIAFFIVPRFEALVADFDGALPVASAVLLSVSEGLRSHPIPVVLVVLAPVLGGAALISRYPAHFHRLLLQLPLIGGIRHGFATARAGRTVGTLLGAGTSAVTALETAARSVGDHAIRERLLEAGERVAEGSSISRALKIVSALTPTANRMTAIGEASGRLAVLLLQAAALEQRMAERRLESLVRILEPALILAFAAVVAFLAAAVLQAIYSVRPPGL